MSLVTVIMPTYNAEKWVVHAIDSVIDQTYKQVELIVVDDGSSDNTLSVVRKKLTDDYTCDWRLIELGANKGPSAARNIGLKQAAGSWIQFLDADDLVSPTKLEMQMAYCEQAPADVAAVYSPFRRCYMDDGKITWDGPIDGGDVDGRSPVMCLVGGFRPLNGAALIRRPVLEDIGGFDEGLRFWECEEVNVRIAKAGRFVKVSMPEPGYLWRMHRDKSYIGGETARYRLTPVALSWITQLLKAADHQSLDQLALRPEEKQAVLNDCTMWARLLYRTDRSAFREFLGMARSLDHRIAPSHPRVVNLISRYFSYERTEAIASLARAPKSLARKTLRALQVQRPTALFDLD